MEVVLTTMISLRMNIVFVLSVAIFFAMICFPKSADAENLLDRIRNVSEQVDGGVRIDALTEYQAFYVMLQGTLLDHGEPWPHARVHVDQLSHEDQVGFYLLARMSTNRWLSPLLERGDFSATSNPCDDQSYRLQTAFLHSVEPAPWCGRDQLDAAIWLLDQVNQGAFNNKPENLAQVFLLLHTAGGDLSPLEVKAAIIGDNRLEPTSRLAREVTPPYGARFNGKLHNTTSVFESWEDWAKNPAPEISDHDIIFFADQALENNLRFLNRIPRIPSPYFDPDISRIQYMIGNSVSFSGVFGRYNYRGSDTSGDPTFKLIVNTLHLDRAESRTWNGSGQFSYGELNMTDVIEPPVLVFHGPQPIIFARKVTLGDRILKTPLRIWAWINKTGFSDRNGDCPIDNAVRHFSLKQISAENPFRSEYMEISGPNCTSDLLLIWQSLISWEIGNRPQNIFHRYSTVLSPSSGNDPFGAGFVGGFYSFDYLRSLPWDAPEFKQNYTQERVFISNDVDLAKNFFGQSALENWGLSVSRRLRAQITLARISEDLDSIGSLLRRSLLVSKTFFTEPTSATVSELTIMLDEITDLRNRLSNSRRVLPQIEIPRSPATSTVRLVGTGASLDVWSLPSGASVVSFSDPISNQAKYLRVWLPENVDNTIFVEAELEVRTPSGILTILNEEVVTRGYQFLGDYDRLKSLTPRQNNGSDWKIESMRVAANGNYVVTFAVAEQYLPIFGAAITSAPGFSILFDWEIEADPILDSLSFGPIATSLLIEEAGSFEKTVFRPPPGSTMREFTFINRADFINNKRVVKAQVNIEILGSEGELLQSGINIELARQGLASARKSAKLFVPPGFQVAYDVIWHLEDGSTLVGREVLGTGYRHYVDWEG